MNCPYTNAKTPPCDVVQHPYNRDCFFCKVCQDYFDVHEIRNQSASTSLLMIVGTFLVILGILMSNQSVPSTSPPLNPSSPIESD
jgi:hypothetical protein